MTSASREIVDQSGRVLGPRARSTRERLMQAAKRLLEEKKMRDVKVVDIAREVDASPATFYQYFRDVEDVVLQLAEQAADEMPALAHEIEEPWTDGSGLERARRIVDTFIRHWDDYHAVLRIRNLASDEGDRRFQRVRARTHTPILQALAHGIEAGQRSGRVDPEINPKAAAAAMSTILERLAAYHNELTAMGVTREDLVETSARILYHTVTGK